MRKPFDIVGDYSGEDTHSGISKNLAGLTDSDFQTLIEACISKWQQKKDTHYTNECIPFLNSIHGCLKELTTEEKIRKCTYAVQQICEVQKLSNLDLVVVGADKKNGLWSVMQMISIFFAAESLSGIISNIEKMLMVDPSLDHIIKPTVIEILFQFFHQKEITLENLCTYAYENQSVIDIIFFTKRLQAFPKIELNDVIQLFEKQKNNPSFLEFLQRMHFIFDETELKPDHKKHILPGVTKNHLKVGGKTVHIHHNLNIQNQIKMKKRISSGGTIPGGQTNAIITKMIGGMLSANTISPIYGLEYTNGKYSLQGYEGTRYYPVKESSKQEMMEFIQQVGFEDIKAQLDPTMNISELEEFSEKILKSGNRVDKNEIDELDRRAARLAPIPISDKSLVNIETSINYSPFNPLSNTIQQVESGTLLDEKVISEQIYSGVTHILKAIENRKNGRDTLAGKVRDSVLTSNSEKHDERHINSCLRIASQGKYRSSREILSLLKTRVPVETLSGIVVAREDIDAIVQRFGYEYVQTPYAVIAGRDYHSEPDNQNTSNEMRSYDYANKLEAIFQMIASSKHPPKERIKIYGSEDQSYAFFYYAEKNVTIFVSNLYGKATYIFRGEITSTEIAKTSLMEITKYRTLLERLYYNPDAKDAWLKRVISALEPQKDAANILVRLYEEGILKNEHISTSQKFNAFITNWNGFIVNGGPNGDFPLSDPWTDFLTKELIETGDYRHLRLASNRINESCISINGIISALGGDRSFSSYKGMTYFLGDYMSLLLQNQLYPDDGYIEMAKYLSEEVFQGAGASKNVKEWVDRVLQGELIIDPVDLQSWTSKDTRLKYNIPVGIQTLPTLGIKLKLPANTRTPDGIFTYITSVQQQVHGNLARA